MLFSSFSTRSMVFAYFAKAQLPFSLFRDLFNDTAEFTLCYGLHDCSHLFQGYFIHSLSTLYYYNAPSLTTRLTGDYRDRTYTGKCSPALLDTRRKKQETFFRFPAQCAVLWGWYLVVKVRDKLTRCIRNNKPEVYKLNLLQQKCKYSLTDISLLFKIPITTNITSATVR